MTALEPVERAHEQTNVLLGTEAIVPAQTPVPHPAPMPTQDIVVWTPARLARTFAAAILRIPVPTGRKLLPKA